MQKLSIYKDEFRLEEEEEVLSFTPSLEDEDEEMRIDAWLRSIGVTHACPREKEMEFFGNKKAQSISLESSPKTFDLKTSFKRSGLRQRRNLKLSLRTKNLVKLKEDMSVKTFSTRDSEKSLKLQFKCASPI